MDIQQSKGERMKHKDDDYWFGYIPSATNRALNQVYMRYFDTVGFPQRVPVTSTRVYSESPTLYELSVFSSRSVIL